MQHTGFTLFDTPLGSCGIAWTGAGIAATALPGPSRAVTRATLHRLVPGAMESVPPEMIVSLTRDIRALLSGERVGFEAVPLDRADLPDFDEKVLELCRAIPAGETRTYGELAAELGGPVLARAVGQALGRNRWPIIVPCHRVLASGGRAGGFSAPGGVATKFRLLEIEGAAAAGPAPLFGSLPFAARPRARRS